MLDSIADIQARCHPTCRTCKQKCLFLTELDVNGLGAVSLWRSGADARIPYSCTSCNLCVVNCSRRLDLSAVFRTWRQEVAADGLPVFIATSPYQTDQPDNLYRTYRQKYPAGEFIPEAHAARVAFFPGCALSAFTPELAQATYEVVSRHYPGITWLDECCYDPVDRLGLPNRFASASRELQAKVHSLGIETIITACPTCHYRLASSLAGVSIVPIYEVLQREGHYTDRLSLPVTVHDACPDRLTQTFGKSVRGLLRGEMRPMKNEGKQSLCCGAGAGVGYFNPDLARRWSQQRREQAINSGAKLLVTYCTHCALQLVTEVDELPVTHILDLILGIERDYGKLARRAEKMTAFIGDF